MEVYTRLKKAGLGNYGNGDTKRSYELRKTLYARETNEKIPEAVQKLNRLKSVKSSRKYFRIYMIM